MHKTRLTYGREADLEFGAIHARAKKLLGDRASTYVALAPIHRAAPFTVALWLDGNTPEDQKKPPHFRMEKVLGRGASWDEAFKRAELALYGASS